MTRTIEERERLAYITGDVALAAALAEVQDAEDDGYDEGYCDGYKDGRDAT